MEAGRALEVTCTMEIMKDLNVLAGPDDLLGEYTHVVLKDLNELVAKYMWR